MKINLKKFDFIKNLSIKLKIILSFSLLIIVTLSTIGLISMSKFSSTLETNTGMYSYQIIDQVIKNVDFYIKDMENISNIANYDYHIQKYLKNNEPGLSKDRFNDVNTIATLLKSIGSTRNDIVSILIIGNNGSVICSNVNVKINKSYNFVKQKWYRNAIEGRGKATIEKPHKQSYLVDSNTLVISLCRSINSYDGKEQLGVILIDLNLKVLDDICSNVKPGKKGYVFIVDDEGNFIYHPDYSYMYRTMDEMYIRSIFKADDSIVPDILQLEEGSFIKKLDNEKKQVTYKRIKSTNWTVASVTPYNEMIADVNNVKGYIIVIGCICLICAFAVSVFISSRISDPVRRLELLMEEAEKGNLDISLDFDSKDEIGLLSQRFNNMIERIKVLMQQVIKKQEDIRKAEFKALQAQINPHFLYNTLDSIIWMAETNSAKVITMIDALAKLLRISLSRGIDIITVEDEIEHVRNYLVIQSMRYANKFDYEIDIDDEVLTKNTLKLILQPLVENSIYHGIKNKRQKGKITIKGRMAEDKILLEVIDDGIGMDAEMCEKLLSGSSIHSKKGYKGMGIKNVNERIQLYCGKDCGLKYISEPGVGTTVQVWLSIL
jgi:two-component system sensor histidine kinase YesM